MFLIHSVVFPQNVLQTDNRLCSRGKISKGEERQVKKRLQSETEITKTQSPRNLIQLVNICEISGARACVEQQFYDDSK